MRRLVFVMMVATLVAPASASAGSPSMPSITRSSTWHTFSSKRLGFAFRYPPGWKLIPSSVAPQAARQVIVWYQGRSNYQLNASLLPFKADRTLLATLKRFLAYERSITQSTMYAQIRWTSASLGGKPALAGVLRPPTEGGVAVANGIYLSQWRSRVYEVIITSTRSPALSQLGQFPSIYRKILATWRFI